MQYIFSKYFIMFANDSNVAMIFNMCLIGLHQINYSVKCYIVAMGEQLTRTLTHNMGVRAR